MKMNRALSLAACLFLVTCTVKDKREVYDPVAHEKEIREWQQKRNAYQVSETGWVNLAGLFWLKEGINTFGSGPDNDLVFPEGKIRGTSRLPFAGSESSDH
jgi:uncharacterized protein